MKILKPIKFIINHPITRQNKLNGIGRFVFWQLYSRFIKNEMVFKWIGESRLYMKKGLHGVTGNYYCYLHDFEEMSFVLHFLNSEDVFWDIGANVGSYSILAAKVRGVKTVAFEPVPETFEILSKNVKLNSIDKIMSPLNIGLSDKDGTQNFTYLLDAMNHVSRNNEDSISRPVKKIDTIIKNLADIPTLIKLDVEGFEYPVLKGGNIVLKNPGLKAIIIELNGLGRKYGYQDKDVDELLKNTGFRTYTYDPFKRNLSEHRTLTRSQNFIYCRDINFINERLQKSPPVRINNLIY